MRDRPPSGGLQPIAQFLGAIHVPFTRHEQKRTRHESGHEWLRMGRVRPKIDEQQACPLRGGGPDTLEQAAITLRQEVMKHIGDEHGVGVLREGVREEVALHDLQAAREGTPASRWRASAATAGASYNTPSSALC